MNLSPTASAYSLAAYLESADLVAATSVGARENVAITKIVDRSFAGGGGWSGVHVGEQTALSDGTPIIAAPPRPEDHVLADLAELRGLSAGWDGEAAARPLPEAIRQATRFVRVVGSAASLLDATLHVDGSVILDIADGESGTVRFRGDWQIVFALSDGKRGIVPFDGLTVPEELERVLLV